MKRLVPLVVLLLFCPLRQSFALQDSSVEGYWKTIDDGSGQLKSVVKLWIQDGRMVGRILRTFPKPGEQADPDKKCEQCEGKLKAQRIRGMLFLWGFKQDPDDPNRWLDGEIVDPESGKQYGCELKLIDGGNRLEVFGYIRILFKVGRSQVWQRATQRDADLSAPVPSIS